MANEGVCVVVSASAERAWKIDGMRTDEVESLEVAFGSGAAGLAMAEVVESIRFRLWELDRAGLWEMLSGR